MAATESMMEATKVEPCTATINPRDLYESFGPPQTCGRSEKGRNADGAPRCGIHMRSEAAKAMSAFFVALGRMRMLPALPVLTAHALSQFPKTCTYCQAVFATPAEFAAATAPLPRGEFGNGMWYRNHGCAPGGATVTIELEEF